MIKEIEDIIASIYPVSGHSLRLIIDLVEYDEFKKGSCFIEKGTHNYYEYFLMDGVCRSFVLSPEGEEITIAYCLS